jgi:hypothetical protein
MCTFAHLKERHLRLTNNKYRWNLFTSSQIVDLWLLCLSDVNCWHVYVHAIALVLTFGTSEIQILYTVGCLFLSALYSESYSVGGGEGDGDAAHGHVVFRRQESKLQNERLKNELHCVHRQTHPHCHKQKVNNNKRTHNVALTACSRSVSVENNICIILNKCSFCHNLLKRHPRRI